MNNEKFLNQTGLSYYHDRAKTQFENKIEKIKVNGDAVIPVNKEVNINVATVNSVEGVDGKTSIVSIKDSLIDDGIAFVRGTDAVAVKFGEYSQNPVRVDLPTKDYVDNAVKIDKIKVNGNEQTITNKEVNIETPEFTISHLEDVVKEVHIKNKIDGQTAETLTLSEARDNCVRLFAENDLIQDTPLDIILASKNYVNANGGKIDKIKVNGTAQTITNKEVNLYVGEISQEGTPRYNVNTSGLSVKGKVKYVDNSGMNTSGNGTLKMVKDENGVKVSALIETSGGMFATGFNDKILPDKDYVDNKGSIAIDSANNNKTTFTVGSKTSSLATNPDGVIYTEGATATALVSKAYVDDAIADVTGMEFVQVDTLPAEGEKGKIYLVPNNTAGDNIKDEYIWIQDGPNGRFEKIGSTDVDLSNYYNTTNLVAITTAEIDALFA